MYKKFREEASTTRMEVNLTELLKDTLVKEYDEIDKCLEAEDITELLDDGSEIVDDKARASIFGYPSRPLYRELGSMLQYWMENRFCPVLNLPNYNLLDERNYVENRAAMISSVTPLLEGLQSLWTSWTSDERRYRLRDIIKYLGRRGLLDLLGVRKTVGTYDIWPPARRTIEATFIAKHSPNSDSVLTVGARALAKHSHRDESSSWWGVCTGSESAKNKHAEQTMKKILDNATWLNIHGLPHDVKVIEARQENGYGVRWTTDGEQFRGFLEPQMEDGHAVGWKH